MLEKINRPQEGMLLNRICFLLLLGFTLVYFSIGFEGGPSQLVYPFLLGAAFYLIHFVWEFTKYRGDEMLFSLSACLIVLGLIMIYRLKPELLLSQIIWIILGLAILLFFTIFLQEYHRLEDYKYFSAFLSVFLLVATVLFGVQVGGNKSWLSLGFVRFEPAEIVKILMVIFLAGFLQEKKELLSSPTWKVGNIFLPHPKHFGPLLLMWGLSLILVVFQKDLGMALLLFGIFLAMLYVSTSRISYVLVGIALFLFNAWLCYLLFSHVRVRVDTWINPWNVMQGKGYQITQSLFSLGAGGLFGTGLGLGHPNFIPAVHTDFIFAAMGEELGFLGASMVLLIYILLIYRSFRIALQANDDYSLLLASGLATVLAWQTFVIIGGVIKLIPLTGITLPFISYGGSSLIANFIILALLLNISHQNRRVRELDER